MIKLYHREIGFPKRAEELFEKSFNLTYSGHAKKACISDRYGIISKPPFVVKVTEENLIEVEIDSNLITKAVVRVTYDSYFDLVIVFIPKNGLVKTVWLNSKNDSHGTLKKELYCQV